MLDIYITNLTYYYEFKKSNVSIFPFVKKYPKKELKSDIMFIIVNFYLGTKISINLYESVLNGHISIKKFLRGK